MPSHRAHVVEVPTTSLDLFLYSHYADQGHDPQLAVELSGGAVILSCEDVFKLKPNVQAKPRNRIDIYIPGAAALSLGVDIVALVGAGQLAELALVDPEAFRKGQQTLPHIGESRQVTCSSAEVSLAGCQVRGQNCRVFLDRERPHDKHIEMKGPEVHLGIPLAQVAGALDPTQINKVTVPDAELRVVGEHNPVRKAKGRVLVSLPPEQARNLAATLLHYGEQREQG